MPLPDPPCLKAALTHCISTPRAALSRLVYAGEDPVLQRLRGGSGADNAAGGSQAAAQSAAGGRVISVVGADSVAAFAPRRVQLKDPPVARPEPHVLQYTAAGVDGDARVPVLVRPSREPRDVRAFRGAGAAAAALPEAADGGFEAQGTAGGQLREIFFRCHRARSALPARR